MAALTALTVAAVGLAAAGTTASIIHQTRARSEAKKEARRQRKRAQEALGGQRRAIAPKTTAPLSESIEETERVKARAAAARSQQQQRRSIGGFGATPGVNGRSILG